MTVWDSNDTYYDPTTDDPLSGHPYPSCYSTTHIVLSSLIVTLIMLVIVAGNVLVVVAVGVDRNLKGIQNWFIASLAVSDLLVGTFIMPLSLANELMGYWPFGDVLCQLWLSTDVLLCTASILNLVLISLDRYWSITKAVSYIRGRTRRRAVVMIAVVWLLSMVICFPPLVGWNRPQPTKSGFPLCVLSEEPGYVVYSTVGSFYLPLIVMVIVYFKIYLVARSHARRHRKKYGANAAGNGATSNFSLGPNTTTLNNHRQGASSVQRTQSQQRRYYADEISQIPEISSDLSNSLQTHDPDPLQDPRFDSAENCAAAAEAQTGKSSREGTCLVIAREGTCLEEKASSPVQLSITGTSDGRVPPASRRHHHPIFCSDAAAAATDSQGDTPTRFLLPHPRRTINLPVVGEGQDSQASAESSSGGTTAYTGSRRRRAKSLPGGSNAAAGCREVAATVTPVPGTNVTLLSGIIARHLWKSRSHRHSPSPRPLELNSTAIPTIKIHADGRGGSSGGLDEAPSLIIRATRASICSGRGRDRPPPSASSSEGGCGGGVDGQQRLRRRMARMKERRATLILGIVMASFVGCWLPFFSLYPVSLIAGFEVPPAVFAVIFWLGYINSALNPIIYTIFNREFRLAFKRLLCGRRKRSI